MGLLKFPGGDPTRPFFKDIDVGVGWDFLPEKYIQMILLI